MHSKDMYSKVMKNYYSQTSQATRKLTEASIRKFEMFHNTSMEKLVEEAIREQNERVPYHKLKIYDRLLDFRNELSSEMIGTTVKVYEGRIKHIYKLNRVEIPPLPQINSKILNANDPIEYEDIITKNEILKAIELCPTTVKARCMAMVTGGYSHDETQHMTIQQFIDDLYPFHQQDNVEDACYYLAEQDNIVWQTKLVRNKTKKIYYGFVNPETTQMIAKSLIQRQDDKPQLFLYSKKYISEIMREINDRLCFKSAGGRSKFRPHMLRKYNATHLKGDGFGGDRINYSDIDELQGRSKNSVQETYIKTNKKELFYIYCKYMNNVSLYNQYDFEIVDDDIKIRCITKKKEDLEKENKELRQEKERLTNKTDGLSNYIDTIGFEAFKEQIDILTSQNIGK